MTLEEAIKTAIEYETRVRDAYINAIDSMTDATGRRVFDVLGKEEQGHIDYLNSRLDEWRKTGHVNQEKLDTVVPSQENIDEGVGKLDAHAASNNYDTELAALKKALSMEEETSSFYGRMVAEMGNEGALFARFLEIEEGHQTIVQAEIDYLTKTGTLFDFQEFPMEH